MDICVSLMIVKDFNWLALITLLIVDKGLKSYCPILSPVVFSLCSLFLVKN